MTPHGRLARTRAEPHGVEGRRHRPVLARPRGGASARSGGQALIEGMVGLGALMVLFWAVPLVGRYQDMALTSAMGSGHAAFLATRDDFSDAALAQAVTSAWMGKAAYRWRDAAGQPLLRSAAIAQHRTALAASAQPGGVTAQALRRGWELEDTGVRVVSMSTVARDLTQAGGRSLTLRRGTAVLADAGHAATPAAAQARVARQGPGWRAAQAGSAVLAKGIGLLAYPVDAAWRRPRAGTDWVAAWEDLVPPDRLTRMRP